MADEDPNENLASVIDVNLYGLTHEEAALLQKAKQELETAKKNYEKLAPLRWKMSSFWMQKRQNRRKRRNKTEGDVTLGPSQTFDDIQAQNQRVLLRQNRKKLSPAKALKSRDSCQLSDDDLIKLYRSNEAIDCFATHLLTERRTAVLWLKRAGLDVFEEIAKDWEGGSSLRKLSAKHGPLPQTISNWIKSTGRQVKPRNSNQKYDVQLIRKLKKQRWPTNKIAIHMNLSWATVQGVINDQ